MRPTTAVPPRWMPPKSSASLTQLIAFSPASQAGSSPGAIYGRTVSMDSQASAHLMLPEPPVRCLSYRRPGRLGLRADRRISQSPLHTTPLPAETSPEWPDGTVPDTPGASAALLSLPLGTLRNAITTTRHRHSYGTHHLVLRGVHCRGGRRSWRLLHVPAGEAER